MPAYPTSGVANSTVVTLSDMIGLVSVLDQTKLGSSGVRAPPTKMVE